MAVTRKLNEMIYENKRNLKKADVLKLVYSMQTDMAKTLFDPEKHKSGKEAT